MPTAYNGRLGEASLPTPLLVGAALRAVRIPTNMGVAQLASHSPRYPNSRMRPIFHFLRRLPQRSRRRRAPTSEPIGRGGNTALVGASLRAVRTTSRPRTTDASERRPYQLAALPTRRTTSRPRTTDASERRPYQHHARLAFTLHKQKPAAFLPRALFTCDRSLAYC